MILRSAQAAEISHKITQSPEQKAGNMRICNTYNNKWDYIFNPRRAGIIFLTLAGLRYLARISKYHAPDKKRVALVLPVLSDSTSLNINARITIVRSIVQVKYKIFWLVIGMAQMVGQRIYQYLYFCIVNTIRNTT